LWALRVYRRHPHCNENRRASHRVWGRDTTDTTFWKDPMIALVTGAAGFVGSHLCRYLLDRGDEVRGLDCFTDFYPRDFKEDNLAPPQSSYGFAFTEGDLNTMELGPILDGVDIVYHLAAQPGVRPSWGNNFTHYVRHNISATQRLLETLRNRELQKVVYASSSSVYGNAETLPTSEHLRPVPVSPYGVTKLAGENLCELYRINFQVPTVSLRLFTVYGPGQRPDMAFRRLINCVLDGSTFELYGDGSQTRDFTYVEDVVGAMRAAALSDWCGVANIGGGSRTSMNEVIALIEDLSGPINVKRGPTQKGDVRHTGADTTVAASAFGYAPRTQLRSGLEAMLRWARREARVTL
jgi:nucleoside-diphosphate-sugar epimerase